MKPLLLIIFAALGVTANAQSLKPVTYDTRIQLQLGNYGSPSSEEGMKLSRSIVNNIGFGVEQKINKHLYLKIAAEKWYTFQRKPWKTHYDMFWMKGASYFTSAPGTLVARDDYGMADVSIGYRLTYKCHELYAAVGPSLAYGGNIILKSHASTGDEAFIETDYKNVSYFGTMWELGYNYRTKNNRINIGPAIAGRYYPGQFSEYNIKLNVGYNFKLR